MDRSIYIDNIDVNIAKSMYFEKLNIRSEYEVVKTVEALGRSTYEAVYANISSPNYNASAMDGIALKSDKTLWATDINPLVLKENQDFVYVNTGNIIRDPYDAVIMIEDVIDLGDGKIQILKSTYPWQHIRQIGEDIVATEMIIPSKHIIRPMDIGALVSGGVENIKVYKKPRVGILPTGTEIIEDFADLEEGKIMDSNSRVFEGEVLSLGGIAKRYSPVADDYELLKESILRAVEENDILLIIAGSSAGTKDYTVKLIRELGQVVVHGVAMKPGKPTILGVINNKPVIGIPGYPVSAYLVFDTFVKPLIKEYIGRVKKNEELVEAKISRRITSSLKNEERIRVNLGYVNNNLIATPLSSGAGVTMSLVKADGIAIIPKNVEGIEAGENIKVELLKPLSHIKDTIVSIGSHDIVMDILGDMMSISSGHVGSMGGIMSMRRKECHISPIHLLDEETGEYNISYVKKYFQGNKMALIKGLRRLQGFIVKKGNPKEIKNFKDLSRNDVVYINRQRGAGTRILLDYHLKQNKLNIEDIKGYQREMTTHMAVATGVKTGSADVGLGIYSVAKALDLDFIEIAYEDYDFLVYQDMLDDPQIKKFINLLKSEEFQERVLELGGYKCESTGRIILI